jgi:hypothetical protein
MTGNDKLIGFGHSKGIRLSDVQFANFIGGTPTIDTNYYENNDNPFRCCGNCINFADNYCVKKGQKKNKDDSCIFDYKKRR